MTHIQEELPFMDAIHQDELQEQRRVNAELRRERDALKKALAKASQEDAWAKQTESTLMGVIGRLNLELEAAIETRYRLEVEIDRLRQAKPQPKARRLPDIPTPNHDLLRALRKFCHPDRHPTKVDEATELTSRLNAVIGGGR